MKQVRHRRWHSSSEHPILQQSTRPCTDLGVGSCISASRNNQNPGTPYYNTKQKSSCFFSLLAADSTMIMLYPCVGPRQSCALPSHYMLLQANPPPPPQIAHARNPCARAPEIKQVRGSAPLALEEYKMQLSAHDPSCGRRVRPA